MTILIDIGHPAHVHYFRNFYRLMTAGGHHILFTARKKEVSHELLQSYDIPFTSRGTGKNSMQGKLLYLPRANFILWRVARKHKPDVFMSFSSPYAAQVSKLFGKPHIALDDTEHAKLGQLMYRPFTDIILSPSCYKGEKASKQFFFHSYMELCYLHPNRFMPDENIHTLLGIEKGQPYVVLRFVSWNATHDSGHSGMSLENKRKAVRLLSQYAQVFISSEAPLPKDLEPYKISIPPDRIHDVLGGASLFMGESATMASESAMLGTPAIYLDNDGRGYTDELEKNYQLVFNFTESEDDQQKAIHKAEALLKKADLKEISRARRQRMLADKIDPTAFLVWFVENWPQSMRIIKENPEYQQQFK